MRRIPLLSSALLAAAVSHSFAASSFTPKGAVPGVALDGARGTPLPSIPQLPVTPIGVPNAGIPLTTSLTPSQGIPGQPGARPRDASSQIGRIGEGIAPSSVYDGAAAFGSVHDDVSRWEGEGGADPSGFEPAAPRDLKLVRSEYAVFLSRLGFRDYPREIQKVLDEGGQSESQKKVLAFNRDRYQVLNAARNLAADVMAGLAEQGNTPESMERGTELAARLLALQPLDAPSSLPADIAKKDKDGIVQWMVEVTVQKLGQQLASVVSDVVGTAVAPEVLAKRSEDLRAGKTAGAEARAFARRVAKVKRLTERLLVTAYTDGEIGQTRYAGRALAASLVRFARLEGRPEVEESLRKKLLERDLRLENFVGDTLVLEDASKPGKAVEVEVRTGDFLGERSGGREASEITFAVRPPLELWLKAKREGLLGHLLGLWANPKAMPEFVPGRRFRNWLKLELWKFKKWLAWTEPLQRGYSHVGMAVVQGADGVSMAWAMDNYPNAGEGGIRKIGIAEQFAQNGPFLRLGVARFDGHRVWKAFQEQAAEKGWSPFPHESKGGRWPSLIPRDHYEVLARIPRRESRRLLHEMNERAAEVLEAMLVRYGVAFAYGFNNEIWKAYCSQTMLLAHRLGSQFEIQTQHDHWHPLIVLMKKLGIGDAAKQDTKGRIIWPGSLFIDPRIGSHQVVSYPRFAEVGRLADPYTVPAYVEMDPQLTRDLASLLQLSDAGSIEPEKDVVAQSIRAHLDSRASKNRAKDGVYRSGANRSTGYSAGLEALLSQSDDD